MKYLNRITTSELVVTIVCLAVIMLLPPLGVIIAFLLVVLYLLIGAERLQRLRSIGFTQPDSWTKAIAVCFLLGLVIETCFVVVITPLIEQLTGSGIDLSAYDNIRGNIPNYLLMLLVGWVVGGFIEEILFRGFLVTRISRLLGDTRTAQWLAILLTSMTFGFSHLYQGWSGVISTALISVILGIIFIKSGRVLWYSILTHGFINLVSLTLIFLG